MDRIRVTLIVPGFSADEADWCIPAVRNLVDALERRADVRVLALHYPFRNGTYAVGAAKVHALGGANARRMRRAWLLGRALRWTVAEHRRRPADVLHGLWADEAGLLAVTAARLLSVPAVVSLMGGELVALRELQYGGRLRQRGRRLVPATLRRAAAVTVGSAALERLAAPHLNDGRLERLPLGVDTQLFRPDQAPTQKHPLRDGSVRLLSVASLTPVKDHSLLLRALPKIAARVPGVHLHLVGDGPLRPGLARLAASFAVPVTFHGSVPHDRLPAFYRAADLLVVGSRYESQGMVALEAAACGCPIVGTAVGVLPELPGVETVPVGDTDALAYAVVSALSDRAALAARAAATHDAVRAELTVERTADRLLTLYRRTLDVRELASK